ncbi:MULTISPECIES: HDOD domain-containing protein [unclassified Pseudoalteromonas]|jgi:HD-like signal output (HDOD) protein|uniref:HDOD domain-containing protein n=1 Tax=unclassified Pseudoalteromonas TaxID=194690 RepID=UPI0005A7AF9D|nr:MULTISPECIES: HDOD domain-containing protein [unclassified Pseudoalteromonas]
MSTENALLTILIEKINNDTLVLPTLPEIAVKVRESADDPDVNLMEMADVIGQDPALAARMIKISNSAFLGRTVKVSTLNQAVTRIGLRQIKNIATAMAMEQLFVSQNDLIKNYLDKSWQKSLEVASSAIALLQIYVKNNKHTSLNLDTITLAALVYNIGVLPILTEAERHPEVFANPAFLALGIKKLAGKIGGSIMRAWGFTDDFVEVAESWSNPNYRPSNACYVDFIRIGAIEEGVLKVSNKDEMLGSYVEKGIIPSIEMLQEDDYLNIRNDVKSAFS